MSVIDKQKIIEYLKNHSVICTSEYFGISKYHIYKIMKENDIPLRNRSEELRLTNLIRYGTSKSIGIEKTRQTKLLKYGNPNYSNPDKAKKTKLEKYGDENYCNVDKIKQTKLNKYGNSSYVNVDKAKQTNLERYGTTCSVHNPEIAEKVRKTNLERYGSEHYFSSDTFKELRDECAEVWKQKSEQSMIDKYGVPYYFSTEQGKSKIKESIQEKYGVDYFVLTPACRNFTNDSKPNVNFVKLLEYNKIDYEREFPLGRYSYDFKVEDTLIEINPTPTHNSTWGVHGDPKAKSYHMNKQIFAKEHGYKFIGVWDWDNINKVLEILQDRDIVYARKCCVNKISKEDAEEFLIANHIQSYAKDEIRYGLYYKNNLISVMTFGKPRYNKKYQYELIRYCSIKAVVGGAEKLFSKFIEEYDPNSVISYCDFSKFSGNVYTKLGFVLLNNSITPSKHWYNMKTKKHITDNMLRMYGFDSLLGKEYGTYGKGTSNEQLMIDNGFVEIYDCGQGSFVWTKELKTQNHVNSEKHL